jgi:hypothetical protein
MELLADKLKDGGKIGRGLIWVIAWNLPEVAKGNQEQLKYFWSVLL